MSQTTELTGTWQPPAEGVRDTLMGHPKGLFLLFLVEMWERFSYYGMRGLLVLYLTSPTTGMRVLPPGRSPGFNPGRGWADADATNCQGWYAGLAYLLPLIGGMIADKFIGTHRSMLVGGILIAMGHIALAISGLGSWAQSDLGMSIFVFGLAVIIIGTGHFKPTVSVMVGQLYAPDDVRRDGAFSIFYMGINLGAFLCNLVCGTLGRQYGWHLGFGAAAIGMLAGLMLYMFLRPRYLGHIGEPPGDKGGIAPYFLISGLGLAALAAIGFQSGLLKRIDALFEDTRILSAIGVACVAWVVYFLAIQKRGDRGPVATILIFTLFNAFFWLAFEQAGTSINLFTDRNTNRMLGTYELDTTWFQSVNPFLIIVGAPMFGAMWVGLARRKMNPSQPLKIAMGLILLGLGYVFMTWAGMVAKDGVAKASWLLVVATYTLHTAGELCLSPTGLSYVTKAAPKQYVSLLMGVYFLSSFIANLGGGKIAGQVEKIEKGEIHLPWHFGGQADYFFLFVVTSIGAGIVVLVLTPLFKMMMRNPED